MLPLDSDFALVRVLEASDFILVALDDALDLRFQALHCLGSDLVNLLFLPLLLAHFFGGDPSIFVFLELDHQAIVHDLLLLRDGLVSSLDCLEQIFYLRAELLLVSQEGLDHVDLLLDAILHVLLHRVSLALALFFDFVDLFMRLGTFLLAKLLEHLKLFLLLIFFDFEFHESLPDFGICLARLFSAKHRS